MRKTAIPVLFVFCLIVLFGCLACAAAPGPSRHLAQLVPVDKRVKIVNVDTKRSRLEVTETDKEKTQLYVVIDGYTKVTHQGKEIRWTSLVKGQLIRVKGGLRIDGKIRARDIQLIKKEPE